MVINEQIDKLLTQRQRLLNEINYHHDPFVCRLPAEIGSRIFQFYVEEYFRVMENHDYRYTSTDKHPQFSPLTIGAVCQTWRRFAWSLPRLWTHVQLIRDIIQEKDIPVLRQWLTRSRQLPLSLLIVVRYQPSYVEFHGTSYEYDELASVVTKHSHRWRDFHLSYPTDPSFRQFCPRSLSQPLSLRKLCLLETNAVRGGQGEYSNLNVATRNPTFRPSQVCLNNIILNPLDIDSGHLTQLSMSCTRFRLNDFIQLLQQATLLVSCKFYRTIFINSNQLKLPAHSPVIHHNVKSLLFLDYNGDITDLMSGNFVRFPVLTSLTIVDSQYPWDFSMLHRIPIFIKTSCARLTELSISVLASEYDTLLEVLAATPFLHRLDVKSGLDMGAHQQFFRRLARTPSDIEDISALLHLLPELRSFNYDARNNVLWEDQSIWELIPLLSGSMDETGSRRVDDRRRLTGIVVEGHGDTDSFPKCGNKDVVMRIVELSKSGTSVHLQHNGMDILQHSMQYHGISESNFD